MALVDDLIAEGFLKTPRLIAAFRKIERSDFLRLEDAGRAEENFPIPIGYGQTNSQPATVALMLELLQPRPGDNILDVGCGTGWTTALLAEASGPAGKVMGIELIEELCLTAEANLDKYGFLSGRRVRLRCADAYKGWAEYSPYSRILVSAAARNMPSKLIEQLAPEGRMVIPIGFPGRSQELVLLEKSRDGKIRKKYYPGFIFVPLVGGYGS